MSNPNHDEELCAQAAAELEDGNRDEELWDACLDAYNGEESRAEDAYIRNRASKEMCVQAAAELQYGNRDEELWAACLADKGGKESWAETDYISKRTSGLMDDESLVPGSFSAIRFEANKRKLSVKYRTKVKSFMCSHVRWEAYMAMVVSSQQQLARAGDKHQDSSYKKFQIIKKFQIMALKVLVLWSVVLCVTFLLSEKGVVGVWVAVPTVGWILWFGLNPILFFWKEDERAWLIAYIGLIITSIVFYPIGLICVLIMIPISLFWFLMEGLDWMKEILDDVF